MRPTFDFNDVHYSFDELLSKRKDAVKNIGVIISKVENVADINVALVTPDESTAFVVGNDFLVLSKTKNSSGEVIQYSVCLPDIKYNPYTGERVLHKDTIRVSVDIDFGLDLSNSAVFRNKNYDTYHNDTNHSTSFTIEIDKDDCEYSDLFNELNHDSLAQLIDESLNECVYVTSSIDIEEEED